MEKENQLGLAHFMEHMAFDGTEEIPENELIHRLERLGLKFGADLNAATTFDQTFYRLDMPKNDDLSIDRSEEHTSELQSLMRISYAVFCLKKKKNTKYTHNHNTTITTKKQTKHNIT